MIEIELNKRKQEKRKVIKTTNSDVNERNLEEFVVTEKPKIHASTTVNSKELLENLDEVSKAIEQFLDTEEVVIENLKSDNERQINTVEKSLPMNEEEIDDHLKSEERKNTSRKEENYKVNEQNEFDRFIKSKIKNLNEEISSTTTTTIEEKNEKTTTTLPELLIADYRRRIPVRYRYNTEFEKLAHDYQERLMMAGGIEDVFKILRNAKIALYSSPKISSKNNNN
uniref:Uncharacterized protein n=1 Tax=Parastrongyloides trichosuri TaxID=131310 RepID=A0A0N4ZP29_PARTI